MMDIGYIWSAGPRVAMQMTDDLYDGTWSCRHPGTTQLLYHCSLQVCPLQPWALGVDWLGSLAQGVAQRLGVHE